MQAACTVASKIEGVGMLWLENSRRTNTQKYLQSGQTVPLFDESANQSPRLRIGLPPHERIAGRKPRCKVEILYRAGVRHLDPS